MPQNGSFTSIPAGPTIVSTASSEFLPLVGFGGSIDLGGTKLQDTGERWHYVFVFPDESDDANNADYWNSLMPDASEAWDRIFTHQYNTAYADFDGRRMTRRQFHNAVREQLVELLTGPICAFRSHEFRSIDGDELFLLIALDNYEVINEVGKEEEFPAMLHPDAYKNYVCPTDWSQGGGAFNAKTYGEHIDGTQHTNQYPGYVRFSEHNKNLLARWNHEQLIRLVRRRMKKFVRLQSLISEGVAKQVFCAHHWKDLSAFRHKIRWNDPCNVLQWPSEELPDCIQVYFGPDIAFFFHWFNAYSRWLLFPAALCIPVGIEEHMSLRSGNEVEKWWSYVFFSVALGLWSTAFLSRYKHNKNLKVLKWGMQNYDEAVAEVRRDFSDDYRDTWAELLQNSFHWILCALFMLETVLVTFFVSTWRRKALDEPLGTFYGLANTRARFWGKLLVTINIKVVDWIWTFLSTKLSNLENHRTRGELLSRMFEKLFAVKFVVFYYPFLYTILIKPYVSQDNIQVCFQVLSSDLKLFFFTQILVEVINLFVNFFQAWLEVFLEIRKVKGKNSGRQYTYIEYQAKCPEYTDSDFVSDVELQVMNYGFLVLFGVCLPYVCFICFCVNFPFKRMLAYKLSYIYQRPSPYGAEGVGAGEEMVTLLSWLGVIFNSYLVIFVSPLCQDMSFEARMCCFVAAEHLLLVLKLLIDAALGPKSMTQRRIEEHQDRVIERILQENANARDRKGHLQVKSLTLQSTSAGAGSTLSNCSTCGVFRCGSLV
eukprot:symbB.v1.2.011632.t1/scaffold740.1/size166498/12